MHSGSLLKMAYQLRNEIKVLGRDKDLEANLCRVMGSAGQGLTALPHSRVCFEDPVLFLGLEKIPGAQNPDSRSWKSLDSPSPPATPEQTLPAFCLQYFDMLYPDDCTWVPKGLGESQQPNSQGGRAEVPKEPEQCPIIDSQGLSLTPEMDYSASLHLEEHSLEQVQSMVVGEVLKDIETACKLLNIAADPADWSPGNVQKWILWTEHQYRLPQIGKSFQDLSGKDLCAMSEEQFRQRSPACGDVLHAHLDIWKSAAWMKEKAAPGEMHYCGNEENWTDSEVDSSCSGQPIHLWQFLKELLLKPHNYGRFIRWLNKEKGIFKIEDSAQVARLWGIRKNRPAMNYDKLSRSIRQYYKKGIIRKPDISQRLVYQFVHPV
uniref:SAM pointed domain-containing Ets transcription factor n=1 Tax=Anolis carolinensis TaxID=28377 RepID=G1KRL3_ANOCA|nr:PREDICTED: SAM pointed domain-containing Ets transcription factor [Anolis carolinensis]|eukprot:XP_003220436.2 PREDICTED: SAM pointed domain-containing Ets transcription factor [Anolis carolinensis]